MTTTLILKAHSWPVKVVTTDKNGDRDTTVTEEIVEPNSERTLYIHSTRSIEFIELPQPSEPAVS